MIGNHVYGFRRIWGSNPHLSANQAGVMELADVVDSKSTGSDTVPVRVRPPAPMYPHAYALGVSLYNAKDCDRRDTPSGYFSIPNKNKNERRYLK